MKVNAWAIDRSAFCFNKVRNTEIQAKKQSLKSY